MTASPVALPGRLRPPSAELTSRLERRLAGGVVGGKGDAAPLAEAGLTALGEARREPGRVRESAYRLLEADALLTYACLAALDLPDAEGFLVGLVSRAASDDR